MANFLSETVQALVEVCKTPDDIHAIYSNCNKFITDWDNFCKHADFEYDDGYGSRYIMGDLKIVFKDRTWLERFEYDGSECWDYKAIAVALDLGPLTDKKQFYTHYKDPLYNRDHLAF